jgi:hypothetical protein
LRRNFARTFAQRTIGVQAGASLNNVTTLRHFKDAATLETNLMGS